MLNRFHKKSGSFEKKRESDGSNIDGAQDATDASEDGDGPEDTRRRIFFNIPLPDDAKDEEGHHLANFGRNKIRTAKYTPLSFIPKNLWFQFHNVANVYFLFVIILGVRLMVPMDHKATLLIMLSRFLPFLVPRTQLYPRYH